jgi:hypothetical protein
MESGDEKKGKTIKVSSELLDTLTNLKSKYNVRSYEEAIMRIVQDYESLKRDYESFRKEVESLRGKNPGGDGEDVKDPLTLSLQAMQMIDDGHSPIEIMRVFKMDFESMKKILREYNELKNLTKGGTIGGVILEVANLFGTEIRERCNKYSNESGICMEYRLYEVEELEKIYPSLFKSSTEGTRWMVRNNPWICVFCRRGVI